MLIKIGERLLKNKFTFRNQAEVKKEIYILELCVLKNGSGGSILIVIHKKGRMTILKGT